MAWTTTNVDRTRQRCPYRAMSVIWRVCDSRQPRKEFARGSRWRTRATCARTTTTAGARTAAGPLHGYVDHPRVTVRTMRTTTPRRAFSDLVRPETLEGARDPAFAPPRPRFSASSDVSRLSFRVRDDRATRDGSLRSDDGDPGSSPRPLRERRGVRIVVWAAPTAARPHRLVPSQPPRGRQRLRRRLPRTPTQAWDLAEDPQNQPTTPSSGGVQPHPLLPRNSRRPRLGGLVRVFPRREHMKQT